MKTYQYRLYPTKQQEQELAQWFGSTRFVYNWGLTERKNMYEKGEKCNYYTLQNKLPELKKENLRLKEVGSQQLQYSLRNLERSYQNFFKKRAKYPRYKSKKDTNSLIFPQHTSIVEGAIKLPKLGKVLCKFHRECRGKVKSMSVKRTATGKYFVSILTDYQDTRTKGTGSLGIDVGIKELVVCSNGMVLSNPKFLKKSLKQLKKQSRRLSRKQKGSKNRNKQRVIVASIHERVANQRKDYLHKCTAMIAREYETVVLERLNIKGMMINHKLAQAIGDVGRGMFGTMLGYKMNVKYVNPRNTSKTCSNCGNIKKELKLSDRRYVCYACGYEADRDENASINILKVGTGSLEPSNSSTPMDSKLTRDWMK